MAYVVVPQPAMAAAAPGCCSAGAAAVPVGAADAATPSGDAGTGAGACGDGCGAAGGAVSRGAFLRWWQQLGAQLADGCADAADPGAVSIPRVRDELSRIDRLWAAQGELAPGGGVRPFGLPVKQERQDFSPSVWEACSRFIAGGEWWHDEPALPSDRDDPLLARRLPYGAFMLGFDFHLTAEGPRLIEVNTNAGGLATALWLGGCCEAEKVQLRRGFVTAVRNEHRAATGAASGPAGVAIVDDAVDTQGLYPEMLHFARILELQGIPAAVVSPGDLELVDGGGGGAPRLVVRGSGLRVDFVYNRLTDFRLAEPSHAVLRAAALRGAAVVSPHPATYARIADKRLLTRMRQCDVVPEAVMLGDRAPDEWAGDRKQWVFKPPEGAASKGVYRGDKISGAKLRSLPPDTIAQRLCPPSVSGDGTKYDLRVYTHGTTVLGLATRHFTGQVMEMRSEGAGFRAALPDGVCCFSALDRADGGGVDTALPPDSPDFIP